MTKFRPGSDGAKQTKNVLLFAAIATGAAIILYTIVAFSAFYQLGSTFNHITAWISIIVQLAVIWIFLRKKLDEESGAPGFWTVGALTILWTGVNIFLMSGFRTLSE